MKRAIYLVILSLSGMLGAAVAPSSVHNGEVYLPNSDPPVLLYKYERVQTQTPPQSLTQTKFLLPDNSVAVAEELVHDEDRLLRYSIERKKEGLRNSITVKGNKATYETVQTSTGKTSTSSDDWGSDHVVIPDLHKHALANWDALQNGKRVEFRLAIVEKQTTYGFKAEKDSEGVKDGKKIVTMKVAPTSFFVSLAISPIYLDFDADTRRILKLRGFKFPKPAKGANETRDIESDLIYLYN